MNEELKHLLKAEAPAGPNRWWRVRVNPKNQNKPITVTLMEFATDKKSESLSTAINSAGTIAKPKNILAAAQHVLNRAGNFRDVIGNYGMEDGK